MHPALEYLEYHTITFLTHNPLALEYHTITFLTHNPLALEYHTITFLTHNPYKAQTRRHMDK